MSAATPARATSATDAAGLYREVLERSGAELVEFGIAALDRTGIPVHTVAAFLPGGRLRNGVGYGIDEDHAQASALGECLEVLLGTQHLPSSAEHPERPGCADPRALILDAGSPWEPGSTRRWVTATRLTDGAQVEVPLEWVAHTNADLPAGYAPLITPITNGLGAGASYEAAVDHALRELVQRDGNAVAYRALDRGIAVDTELPAPAAGITPILKVAYCDLGMANVYVVGDDRDPPHPLSVTACGEAAHPDRDVAIGKALREFAASHVRKRFNHGPLAPILAIAPERYREHVASLDLDHEEPRALEAMLGWLELSADELRAKAAPTYAVHEQIALSDLPHAPERTTRELLEERGFAPLVVDLSGPDAAATGVHVVKAIVPGLEVETVSYGRCGARNLDRLLERDLGVVGLGAARPDSALPLSLPDGRDAWIDPARMDAIAGPLYPLYREPARHVAALVREAR